MSRLASHPGHSRTCPCWHPVTTVPSGVGLDALRSQFDVGVQSARGAAFAPAAAATDRADGSALAPVPQRSVNGIPVRLVVISGS